MAQNINSVVLVGNLTKDPELRHTPAGTAVTTLRVAVNDRVKRGEEWTDAAYYFDVTVWGRTAENCAQYLAKGRPVGVQGKLTWREWDAQDGTKRQSVEIVADNIQFLGGRDGGDAGGGQQFVAQGAAAPASDDFPAAAAADDDIPF
jgi:single-strand DNA-binding protein